MKIKIIKPPFDEIVPLDEALDFLRVDDESESEAVRLMISVAREFAEDYTYRKFLSTGIQIDLLATAAGDLIDLPFGDFIIDSVTANGKTLLNSDYQIIDYQIKFINAQTNVVIKYTAGLADSPLDLPASIKQAMLMFVGALYEQRSDLTFNLNVKTSPLTSRYLLNPLRLY